MATTTLGELRNRSFQMADMAHSIGPDTITNNGIVGRDEMTNYINYGYRKLYGLLTMTAGDNYFYSTNDITLVGGTEDYALPADFGNLIGVDFIPAGDTNQRFTLLEMNWQARNQYRDMLYSFSYDGWDYKWIVLGNNIRVAPIPNGSSSDVIRLHYVPEFTPLVNDTDTVLTEKIFDEYISTYAAIRAQDKEETDSSALRANLADLEKFVINFGESRVIAQPRQIAIVQDDYMGQTINPTYTGFRNQ